MRSSYRALCAILAGLSIIATGCGAVASQAGRASQAGHVAGARLHPHGPFPGLRYRDGGAARLTSAPQPASSALPGANDLLAAGTGVLAATDTGIWRSADGGTSWHRMRTGIEAWSLAAVPGGGYAALGSLRAPNGPGAPVLATSKDGISWQLRQVRAPSSQGPFGYGYRFALSGPGATAAGVAVPDAGALVGGQPAYRTTDGGLHWTPLPLRGASTGLAMLPDGRTVFATAPGRGPDCAGAVYQSVDAGASWALLRGSCQRYPLLAVQFISARHGFAAGGLPAKFGGEQIFEATSDGGRTWHARWRSPVPNGPSAGAAFLRLDMLGARQGWAVTGGCVEGQNGPCPGTVYVTADGGARWHRTSQDAIAIAGLGAGRAVVADDRAQTTSVSSDFGRTWSTRTTPAAVSTSAFTGAGDFQLWVTSLGDLLSRDGGRRWTLAGGLTAAKFAYLTWLAAPPARLLGYSPGGGAVTWSSDNGGRTWTTAAVPGAGSANSVLAVALGPAGTAIAVTGPGAQCLSKAEIAKTEQAKPGWKPPAGASVLHSSADGGARWRPGGSVLPFGVGVQAAAAADRSRIAAIDACGNLQLSADAGAHWRAQALGRQAFCTVSVLGPETWLACRAGEGDWVLHSADAGRTWLAYRLPATASAASGIFATGSRAAVMPIGGSIWRTIDGGQSWTQAWPRT
jgi:photosystem II stability/assembly factor-like uncharacterized protein